MQTEVPTATTRDAVRAALCREDFTVCADKFERVVDNVTDLVERARGEAAEEAREGLRAELRDLVAVMRGTP